MITQDAIRARMVELEDSVRGWTEALTMVIVDYHMRPPVTDKEQILNGLRTYFSEIGCHVEPRPVPTQMTLAEYARDMGERPFKVSLPYSQDVWTVELDQAPIEPTVVCWLHVYKGHERQFSHEFKVPLSDPDSLPKMVAYMQKKSKFLRGGLSSKIPKVEA